MISIGTIAGAAYETARISVPTIVDGLLGRVDPRACDRRLEQWSRRLLERSHVELIVEGRGNVVPGESYVVMSNHQSHYDIPVIYQALQVPLRMVAKRELFSIPFMGSAMRYAGFIEVDRGRHAQAVGSLNRSRHRLERDGTSVWIAPEGTRSLDGQLGKFKRGGFVLAVEAGLRILPVAIDGSRRVLPARGVTVQSNQRVHVSIGAPVDPSVFGRGQMSELVSVVRQTIATELARLQA